jgi:ribosome biogenesis GTPase
MDEVSGISSLIELGFSPHWQALHAPYEARGLAPARVIRAGRGGLLLATPSGVRLAKPAPRLINSIAKWEMPVVGDWVAVSLREDLDLPLVEGVLDRTSAIMRGDPGDTSRVQVLAANMDIVFVVHPIVDDPNLRRIERELALAWESGAVPVVVLAKADLSSAPEEALAAVQAVAIGADVHLTSAVTGVGVESLREYVARHRTAVLIGPSGAGKSTIINALLGEDRLATREVRVNDGRGRHTTVARELVQLSGGGLLIDTPGLRALALTGSEEGIASTFPEIEELARQCRFRDCAHTGEPGCAVQAAVEAGTLQAERLESYEKLTRETRFAATQTDPRLRAEEERRWKIIAKARRDLNRQSGREG